MYREAASKESNKSLKLQKKSSTEAYKLTEFEEVAKNQ